jgi:hypothetical protein
MWIRLLLISLLACLAAGTSEPESLRQKSHSFRQGPRLLLAYQARIGQARQAHAMQASYGHGITNGISLTAIVPVLLHDSAPYPPGSGTPRIGGGLLGRPQISGLFRLWDEGLDFLAVELGAGLPIQTDSAARNSIFNSWVLLGSLGSELSWNAPGGELVWRASFSYYPSLPGEVTALRTTFLVDPRPFLLLLTSLQWYVTPELAPAFGYFESFPTRIGVVTDNPRATILLTEVPIPRARSVFASLDFSLKHWPVVLTLEQAYALLDAGSGFDRWQTSGRMRWVF